WLDVLTLNVAARATSVIRRKLLQAALPCLVADRTIQRVIDEEKLHHAFTTIFHQLRIRLDPQPRRSGRRTGDRRTRHPHDLLDAVLVEDRLACRAVTTRHPHFHEAHTAVTHDRKLRMVAVVRDLLFHHRGGIDHVGARSHLHFDVVDENTDEVIFLFFAHLKSAPVPFHPYR